MDRFNMPLKAVFRGCLIVTLFTTKFDSIMDRFHMSFKAAFLSRLKVTIFTAKCNSISYFSSLLTFFYLTKVRELSTRTIPHCDYLILSIEFTDEGGSDRFPEVQFKHLIYDQRGQFYFQKFKQKRINLFRVCSNISWSLEGEGGPARAVYGLMSLYFFPSPIFHTALEVFLAPSLSKVFRSIFKHLFNFTNTSIFSFCAC